MKNNKREKFVKLANSRVISTLDKIRLIGNLADKNNYHYTNEDTADIAKALKQELNDTLAKFKSLGSNPETSGFKFSNKK